jgi:hypothetical protein
MIVRYRVLAERLRAEIKKLELVQRDLLAFAEFLESLSTADAAGK